MSWLDPLRGRGFLLIEKNGHPIEVIRMVEAEVAVHEIVEDAIKAALAHAMQCTDPFSCIADGPTGSDGVGCVQAIHAVLCAEPSSPSPRKATGDSE